MRHLHGQSADLLLDGVAVREGGFETFDGYREFRFQVLGPGFSTSDLGPET